MATTAPSSITLPLVHFEGPWTARERERLSAAAKQFDGSHSGRPAPEESGVRWVAVKTPASWGTLYATHRLGMHRLGMHRLGMHRLGTPAAVTTARSLSALIDMLQVPVV